jgi:O-antigen/teichoic acid export membrane protein
MHFLELNHNRVSALLVTFLLVLPTVFIISASSSSLIRLFYSGKYAPAAYPLAVLVIGLGAFTIFNILTTVINAAGRPGVPMIMTAALVHWQSFRTGF